MGRKLLRATICAEGTALPTESSLSGGSGLHGTDAVVGAARRARVIGHAAEIAANARFSSKGWFLVPS